MSIEKIINDAWESRDKISPNSDKGIIDAANETIELLYLDTSKTSLINLTNI